MLDITRAARSPRVRWLVAAIAAHSCLLGIGMLAFPARLPEAMGFGAVGNPFFPSQSGVFLLILGLGYFAALREPAYLWLVIVSKTFAVAFLVTHGVLGGPVVLWAAAAGDGAMLSATVLLVWREQVRLPASP